ncbi:MAG TPA: hypothetical protein PLI13_07585 [Paracoccus sp. (in: a-proteobacteria)]|nr:hypothetical protein [Paracoccus sp. (in: a-proteobacteria)]
MSIYDGYSDHFDATARLTVLRALSAEADYRLNDTLLMRTLEAFAIKRGRSYLRNQLRWLEQEAGAVKLHEVGSVLIAELTEAGLDHVERRLVLDGVLKPSPVRR